MNKAILIGRLTHDPELRYAANTGTAVCRFRLAVNRPKIKDQEQKADFITCVAFGKTAEAIAQYLTKGKKLAIEGSIRTGSYDAQDGSKRYTTEVYIDKFYFIESRGHEESTITAPNGFKPDRYIAEDMEQINGDDDIPF